MGDRLGQQMGNYRLVKLLGKGGFAEVYLGQHVHLASKQAAIKILHLIDVDARKFQEEAETTEKLVHPHIVRLLDFALEQGTPFLVLDYAPGGSLRTRHPKGSIVPLATIEAYLKELAPALQYAHDRHILHRDIKPDNLLIGRQGELLLSDFGIAVLTLTGRTSLSSAYGIGGTPFYMAPETFRGRPDKASDQYALAVVVYEWLCGSVPFSEGDFIQLGYQHAHESVPPLRERNPAIPLEVAAVIMKALAKEPKDRFGSVQTFVQAFEQACLYARQAEQERLRQAEEQERVRQAEEERLHQEEVARKQVEEWYRAEEERARQNEAERLRQPDAIIAAKPVKHSTSQRNVLIGLAGLMIVALASGIIWFTAHQASPTGGNHASSAGRVTPIGKITEFSLPTASNYPTGITTGPDGNLWFIEVGTKTGIISKIGRITPSSTITEFPLPTSSSNENWGITTGPDGNLWFTEGTYTYTSLCCLTIGRITPSGNITEFPLPTAFSYSTGIADGPDGNLWFTEVGEETGITSKIGRITPSGTITEFPLSTPSALGGIAAGPDGNRWFTEERAPGKIGRITPSGKITEFPLPTAGAPKGIAAGPDGNLWFTEGGLTNETFGKISKIGRISTSGTITEFPVPTASHLGGGAASYPAEIAAGPDGNLWFTEFYSNKIGRITPSGTITEFSLPAAFSNPAYIAAGPDGNLWFTGDGKIGRITTGK